MSPRVLDGAAEAHLVALACSAPPPGRERLEAAPRSLDLDAVSPREALEWLWAQRQQLPDAVTTAVDDQRTDGSRGHESSKGDVIDR